jgi:group I intron endonuclease
MHTNAINNKKYIGITGQNPPERRWRNYGSGYSQSGYFRNAINKYGWENFTHEILISELTFEEACELEKYYIKFYGTKTPNGYNLTDGGEGTVGWEPTEDFRNKQSIIHKKQWEDEDFRRRNVAIRQDENGVYKSQEFRNKISQLVKGEKNPNYQNYWTDEQKNKLREKQKQNPIYKNENNPNAKRVMCIETGEVFDCIKYAREKYQIKSEGSMTVALKYPTRTAGGLHWKYI